MFFFLIFINDNNNYNNLIIIIIQTNHKINIKIILTLNYYLAFAK